LSRYPYLLNRKGHYYFRIAVPKTLVPSMGRRELICSLRTKDSSEATIISLKMAQAVNELFQKVRAGLVISQQDLDRCIALERFKSFPVPSIPFVAENAVAPDTYTEKSIEDGERISALFDQYLNECRGERDKTTQKKKAVFAIWLELHGDRSISQVGKAEARDFKALLMRIPANMHKYFPGKTFRQINLDLINEAQRLSTRSVNGGLAFMRAFFNWAINNGYFLAANPFDGIFLKEPKNQEVKRCSFTADQLKAIFTSPVYTGCKSAKARDRYIPGNLIICDALYWVPLVALYSGARLQEIAQLYVDDVRCCGEFWIFDFNEEGEDKQLKTVSSRRKTPVHPKLIEAGFLEYVNTQKEKGERRVFSDLSMSCDGTYSNIFSKRFNYMLKRLDIKTTKTSFHSFRHTFIDSMRNTDVPREVREALVGHLGQRTAHDMYGSSIGIKRLFAALKNVEFNIHPLPTTI